MISQEVREVAKMIGLFFLQKNGGDMAAALGELLASLITDIKIEDRTVVIFTSLPGRLIGKRGETIAQLSTVLAKEIKIVEVPDNIYFHLREGVELDPV